MSRESILLNGALAEYVGTLDVKEPEAMRALSDKSDALPEAGMRSSPESGRFLSMLVKLIGAKRCFEVGTFTGYSALWVADALPDDGQLVAMDPSEDWTAVGKPFWKDAGVDHKIDLRIGPAADTMQAMIDGNDPKGHTVGGFDYGFIDADKANYPAYYELGLQLLRPGGLMVFDNALMHGAVADAEKHDAGTKGIRAVNAKAHDDDRVESVLMLLADGLLLVRKKS